MDKQARHSTIARITNGTIESICTNDLPSVVKKVVAVSMSSTKAFPTVRLALQLEVPTMVAVSIPDQKMGEEC
jgi:hypothetical protein